MSSPVVFFASVVASMVTSKVVGEVFDNPMLGAIAGMAAGGFVSSVAGGAAAAAGGGSGVVGGSAETVVDAGSALGGSEGALANYNNIMGEGIGAASGTGGAQTFAATETPDIMANAKPIQPGGTSAPPGSSAFASTPTSTPPGTAASKPGLLGISNNEWLKFGGDILSGMADQDQMDVIKKRYEEMSQLERDKFEQEQQKYNDQSAYGLTRDGRRVPLNVAEQLKEINASNQGSSLNRLSNIRGLLRSPSGYASGYGRFQRNTNEETAK